MEKSKNPMQYVVIGSGMITTDKMAIAMKITAKIVTPIPAYSFATTLEKAHEIANQMGMWHDQVIIAKVIEMKDKG